MRRGGGTGDPETAHFRVWLQAEHCVAIGDGWTAATTGHRRLLGVLCRERRRQRAASLSDQPRQQLAAHSDVFRCARRSDGLWLSWCLLGPTLLAIGYVLFQKWSSEPWIAKNEADGEALAPSDRGNGAEGSTTSRIEQP